MHPSTLVLRAKIRGLEAQYQALAAAANSISTVVESPAPWGGQCEQAEKRPLTAELVAIKEQIRELKEQLGESESRDKANSNAVLLGEGDPRKGNKRTSIAPDARVGSDKNVSPREVEIANAESAEANKLTRSKREAIFKQQAKNRSQKTIVLLVIAAIVTVVGAFTTR